MGKGKPSEIWKEIKPRIGEMLVAVNDIETRAEKAQEEAYQRGLNNAWEVARKFMSEVMDARFRNNFMVEIFECDNAMGAMKVYSASECIEKIRQYEQKQEEIKVGDEVIIRNKTAVVTEITDRYVRIMYSDGSCYALFSKGIVKTGRHFPEIVEVLQKMKKS